MGAGSTNQSDHASGEGAASATALHQIRQDWLDKGREPVIDPDLKIVDAHHHLWDMPGNRYLLRDYLDDLASGHTVLASVYVQSGTMMASEGPEDFRSVGETAFAASIAQECDGNRNLPRVCAAIVGSVDLNLGSRAAPVLEAHVEAAQGRLRGVRCLTHWHEDPVIHRIHTTAGLLSTSGTRDVARLLEQMGLVLDIWVYHTQLDEVIDLARACPGLTIVLNHAGTPLGCGPYADRREEVRRLWQEKIATLAEMPNVFVKLGGLAMRFSGFAFDRRPEPPSSETLAATWAPYILECIERFGSSRCMFESNFPVDKASCSYPTLWNAYKRLAGGASPSERSALFFDTAASVYQLQLNAERC